MNSRVLSLHLRPAARPGLCIETYSYDATTAPQAEMAETVTLLAAAAHFTAHVSLTPDEARVLANQLLQVADVCEEARQRRESFDQIRDLMDEDREAGNPPSMYAHPDVHYVPAGQIDAKVAELEAAGLRRYMVLADPYADGASV